MSEYKLSNVAKEDLVRIHHYGVSQFGLVQADKYFEAFFIQFERIAESPLSFEAVDFIKPRYRRCVCGSDTIYYRVKDGVVEIMSILGRQDFDHLT